MANLPLPALTYRTPPWVGTDQIAMQAAGSPVLQYGLAADLLAFAASNGLQVSGQTVINSSTTLTAAQLGTNILCIGSNITLTFPSTAGTYWINNQGPGAVVLSFPGGVTDFHNGQPSGNSVWLFPYEQVGLAGDNAGNWRCVATGGHWLQSIGQDTRITANTTLDGTYAGKNILVGGNAGVTVQFPGGGGLSYTFWLSNTGPNPVTLAFTGGTDFSRTLYPGQSVGLAGDGTGFYRQIAAGNQGNSSNATPPAWTPQLNFGGAHVGMAGTFSGNYMVVGNVCILTCTFTLTALGTSTGAATITGLPIPAADNSSTCSPAMIGMVGLPAPPLFYISGSTINCQYMTATTLGSLTNANFSNTSAMNATFIYRI